MDDKTKERIDRLEEQATRLTGPDGKAMKARPEGGLGFLALGAVGTAAVRKAKREKEEGGHEQSKP